MSHSPVTAKRVGWNAWRPKGSTANDAERPAGASPVGLKSAKGCWTCSMQRHFFLCMKWWWCSVECSIEKRGEK